LLYYNEPAEPILGCRFDETGEMPLSEWSTVFVPENEDGTPMAAELLPLVIALREHHPAHASFHITGLDGARRMIAATGFPLIARSGETLGAVALFWTEGA
jgi:hypothetical protein